MKILLKRSTTYLSLSFIAVLLFSALAAAITPSAAYAQACSGPVATCYGGSAGGNTGGCVAGGSSCSGTSTTPSMPTSGAWVDANDISYNGQNFRFTGQWSGNVRYVSDQKNQCGDNDFIEFSQNPTAANTPKSPGFLDIGYGYSGQPCNWSRNNKITLTNTAAATQTNPDAAKCYAMANPSQTNDCLNKLAAQNCNQSGGIGRNGVDPSAFDACVQKQLANITQTMPASGLDPGPDQAPAADPQGSGDPELDCGFDGGSLNWLLCPVLKIVNKALDGLDNAINDLLQVNQDDIFGNTDSGKTYHAAWQSFEGLGLGIVIAAALIMIISQALGFEFFDAYTIKKVMPRLVIAIIGIALSWELMKWFIGFTNDLGMGVRALIYYPFTQISHNANMLSSGSGIILTLFLSGAALGLGFMGILSLGATALLALFMAFIVLVLRKLVIIVLVLFAPLAIAAYVLPNTNGLYKIWHESFTKALLMYPIIMGFLAAGRVLAVTSAHPGANAVDQLIGIVAYIIPYFLIPTTFRFAGGALRTLGGFVNDRSRGAFDRLKKYRGNKVAENMHAMKTGNRFKGDNFLSKGFNRTSETVAAIPAGGMTLSASKRKARMQASISRNQMDEAAEYSEKNSYFNAIKGNDDFLQAGIHGEGDDSKVADYLRNVKDKETGLRAYDEKTVQQATAAIRAARRDVNSEVFATAATMALPATGTAWRLETDENGNITGGGAGAMHESIGKVAKGDGVKRARMLAAMRSSAGQARRPDLAAGSYSDQLKLMESQLNGGRAVQLEIDGRPQMVSVKNAAQASNLAFDQAAEAQGGYQFLNARKPVVKAEARRSAAKIKRLSDERIQAHRALQQDPKYVKGTPAIRQRMEDNVDRAFYHEAAKLAGRYEEASRAAPENARVWATDAMSQVIRDPNDMTGAKTITIGGLLDRDRGNPLLQEYRREYQNQTAKVAADQAEAARAATEAQQNAGNNQPR